MDSNIVMDLWEVVGVILISLAVGGLGAISLVGVIARNLKDDPGAMAAIEKLGNSIPAETAELLLRFTRSMDSVADLIHEAVDGVPAADKTSVSVGADVAKKISIGAHDLEVRG